MRTIRTFRSGVLGLWLAFAPLAVGHSAAPPPSVVASIGPVYALTAAVMTGVATPTLLLDGGASPHTASLRPSQAANLQGADAVFWIGEELETFLVKPLAALPASAHVVALADAPGVMLLASREGGAWPDSHHDAEHKHDGRDDDHHGYEAPTAMSSSRGNEGHTAGDGHAHGAQDMHIWLDPRNAMAMADIVADTLADIDPQRASIYAANAADLRRRLEALDADLRRQLSDVADRPYIVFHDAYHYLEARYGLSPAGAITISPDRTPGARTLAAIRARITASGAMCVFREPQFKPALVMTVVDGTPARIAVLDPLGADLAPGPDAYFALMRRLADALSDCLHG